jgi:hypothetical protein
MKGNTATREVKSSAKSNTTTEHLVDDKFDKLWSDKTKKPASISMGVQEGLEYGTQKVSATITLNCDQNEPSINKACELAFYKALEVVRDGWAELGVK